MGASIPQPEALRSRQVELILESVDQLPTLSPIAARLLTISSAEDADFAEITRIIESDPALASRIIGLCRRSDKGLGEKVMTVRRAVVMLGIGALRSAALSVSVFDLMGSATKPGWTVPTGYWAQMGRAPRVEEAAPESGPRFDRAGFWKFSVGVACASEIIAGAISTLRVKPDEAFTAGLLHALGKTALDFVLPRSYARVLALAEKQGCDSRGIERAVVGLDYHTAGKRLAEHWGLPEALRDVMWLHGQSRSSLPPTDCEGLVAVVNVARAICRHLHLGWSGDFAPAREVPSLCAEWGLVGKNGQALVRVPEVSASLHEAVADRLKILGLTDASTPTLLMESLAAANRQLGKMNAQAEQRGRRASAMGSALDAVARFQARAIASRSLVDTLGAVARSWSGGGGTGALGAIFQSAAGEAWQALWFGAQGESLGGSVLEAETGELGAMTTGSLLEREWVVEALAGAGGGGEVVAARLVAAGIETRWSCVLVGRGVGPDEGTWNALATVWIGAVEGAWRDERARRMGERLAQLNRSLADAQEQLTRAESLARLGVMTAGAAHEMNNPLTVISGHAQMLASRLEDPRDRSAAQRIVEGAESLGALVASLHQIASPPEPRARAVEVGELLREGVALAELKVASGGRLGVEPPPGVRVLVDPRLVAQVIAELVTNALESSASVVRVSAELGEGTLAVRVGDDGPGLSEAARRHAFDPFFSERRAGRSHGLGLTRARALAERLGGTLELRGNQPSGVLGVFEIPARLA